MERAGQLGTIFLAGLRSLQSRFPSRIREVRGYGLMLGIELDREGEPVVAAMRDRNILINCTDQTVLRFLPPLIITEEHIAETLKALGEILGEAV
jgi:acetylornithine/succinyldiaminopimelate/putrescine aminotransferase